MLRVTQGCFVVLENSSWNLVSSASIQRSLPYGNTRVSAGHNAGKEDTHDVVARHVRVTSVDEQTDTVLDQLGEELRAVARAVALQRERLVDLHVAALEVERGVHAERLLCSWQVHPRVDPLELLVAQVAIRRAVARLAYVVHILARLCGMRVRRRRGERNGW